MRRFHFALSALVLFLVAQPLIAVTPTFYAGNCRIGAYGSISAAVGAATPGSIVFVCPGIYSEQVVISKALTLQGIFDTNSSQAVITVPTGTLATTSSISFGTVVAQVEVTAGPVKINNITVDGTAGANCPAGYFIGILYSSGSSGSVSGVETRNQSCNGNGVGIVAENTAGAAQSVTIQNNNVHNYSIYGISACSDQNPSTLTVTIKGNYVENTLEATDFDAMLLNCFLDGTVSGNTIVGGTEGVLFSASATFSGNTITGASTGFTLAGAANATANTIVNPGFAGIVAEGSGTASSNRILNSSEYGILVNTNNGTVKGNTIIRSPIGIEFQCFGGSSVVSGNTINGATTGMDRVPAIFSGVNIFDNVGTVRTGC